VTVWWQCRSNNALACFASLLRCASSLTTSHRSYHHHGAGHLHITRCCAFVRIKHHQHIIARLTSTIICARAISGGMAHRVDRWRIRRYVANGGRAWRTAHSAALSRAQYLKIMFHRICGIDIGRGHSGVAAYLWHVLSCLNSENRIKNIAYVNKCSTMASASGSNNMVWQGMRQAWLSHQA